MEKKYNLRSPCKFDVFFPFHTSKEKYDDGIQLIDLMPIYFFAFQL